MSRPVDEHLFGAWIPDPAQPDAERIASVEISPAGWLQYVVREAGATRVIEHDYRVETPGRLDIQDPDGRWTGQSYAIEDGPVLVIGERRYLPASDPAHRPWPPEADAAAPSA